MFEEESMSTPGNRYTDLIDDVMSGKSSRRNVLRRAAMLGLSLPAISALLAACGGDDDDDATGTTATSGAGQSTGTSEATGTTATESTATAAATTAGTPSGGGSSGSSGSSPSFEIEEPQSMGGTLIEGTFADAETVNPILVSDTASEDVTGLIFNALVGIDPQTIEPYGDLAEAWEISDDGVEYTFTLRQGVTWHDGEDFTADDVVFTYDMHMNEESQSARTSELVERVASVEASDDQTIVFTLNFPVAPFMASNCIYEIVPEHILADVAAAELAQHPFSTGEKGTTIGTGPFQFEEWIKDDHMTLVKYPDYWYGEPNLDQYVYKVVPDQTVLVQQLKTGELDYSGTGGVPGSSYDELSSVDTIKLVDYDTFDFTFYAYQLDPEKSTLFQEKEVRQALFYALDREAMIEAIRFGFGEVAVGTMPFLSWAYNPEGIETTYSYDPEKAAQMLDDAGWMPGSDGIRAKDGQRLAFTVYTNAGNTVREQFVTIFQQQWAEIGVECTPQAEEWNAFLERITGTKDFEMFLVGFSWDTDPDQSTMWATEGYEGGFNMNKYSNPEVDELLQQGLQTTDQDERIEIYTQMQNILMDELPSAILDFPRDIAGVSTRVHNLFPNDVDDRFNAHQWWIDPA